MLNGLVIGIAIVSSYVFVVAVIAIIPALLISVVAWKATTRFSGSRQWCGD
jgi:hypothetical protein